MDTAQWPQDIGLVKPMEELVTSTTTAATTAAASIAGAAASNSSKTPQMMERPRVRPQKEQALNCPRCNSTNTKFCYYNNYSLTQPRYFCKTCRRYWTEGGSLRNVPVGGGSRKNKRSSALSSSTAATTAPTSTSSSSAAAAAAAAAASVAISNASKKLSTDHHLMPPAISLSTVPSQAPTFHDGQDLNLAFPHHSLPAEFSDFANLDSTSAANNNSSSSNRSNPVNALSAMELLRNGMSGRSLGPFMQMPMAMPEYPAGFGLQEFRRPPLSFPLDGIGAGNGAGTAGGYDSMQGVQENDGGGRMLFTFEDLKQVVPSSTAPDQFEQSRVQTGDPPGFWNGMIGGSGSW